MATPNNADDQDLPTKADGQPDKLDDLPPAPPPQDELTRFALLGDVREVQKLFDGGKFNARSTDPENITPLHASHWAAINGHYPLAHFLIQSGADVNAKGGTAGGTPLLWAQSKQKIRMIRLLLEHGADITICDDQGVNCLNAAVRDNQPLILVLFLLQPNASIDAKDSESYTCLMRAAYGGSATCIEALLRMGADPNIRDNAGRTALNWAMIKGSVLCLQKLLENGADRFCVTDDGQTLSGAARQFRVTAQWHRALSHTGYDKSGKPIVFPLSFIRYPRTFFFGFFIMWPFVMIGLVTYVASSLPVYLGLPAALALSMLLQFAAQRLLRWAPSGMRHFRSTPFLAGVFLSTLAWSCVMWITRIFPYTFSSHPLTNLAFAALLCSTAYFHFMTMRGDPGYVPSSSDRLQRKATIDDLMMNDIYDLRHFCLPCMTRKPIRSKHCKMCNKCVARHDHHCPWADNCIGVNNHAHFVLFMLSLFIGVVLLFRLSLAYVDELPEPDEYTCSLLSDSLCAEYSKDPFGILICGWATVQLVWVSMLLFVQLSQIARARTTLESMRGLHTGPLLTALATGSTSADGAQITGAGAGPDVRDEATASDLGRHDDQGCWSTWKKLLGVDSFVATARHGRHGRYNDERDDDQRNPFSGGVLRNCQDFWCAEGSSINGLLWRKESGLGLLNGIEVDYMRLYQVPRAGLRYRCTAGGAQYQSVADEEATGGP